MNPNGRFRTLKGIYPVLDESGEPRLQAGDICADFETVFYGAPYTLKCLLGTSAKHVERLKEMALFTQLIKTPYLVPHQYLENEITVFDTAGEPHAHDAILRKKPEGTRLCDFLTDAVAKNDTAAIWALGRTLPEMARWLWDNEFSVGSISAKSIYVTPEHAPVLTDYTHAQRKASLTDIRAICVLEAALYCCACEPRLYASLLEEQLTGRSKLIELAETLSELLSDEATSTLTGLLALLSTDSGNYDEYVAYLFELAGQLASESPVRIGSLSDRADAIAGQECTDHCCSGHAHDHAAKNNGLAKYTYLGESCCNLMRAFDGKRWCYVDKTGKQVISGGFIDAGDFEEGRAVVETAGGYGLIDSNGKFVVAPVYDDLDWDSYNNIATATKDGKSGLFSRTGEALTGLEYDHILNCSEGLIPAKRGKAYGYLDKSGTVAIDFVFEDAFGFRDGVARAKRSGHEIIIDREGREIDRIVKH